MYEVEPQDKGIFVPIVINGPGFKGPDEACNVCYTTQNQTLTTCLSIV